MSGMKTTIDRAGRVVVPKPMREQLGLTPGQEIDIRVRGGKIIEIEPRTVPMHVEKRGRVAVIVPDEPIPVMTADEVRQVVERQRDPERRW
jgi:AbrB family looped-hinge helix DNA binding protein